MTLIQGLAIAFIVSVLASPFIGNHLQKRRTRIDRQRNSAECARQEKLCDLADEYWAASTDKERQAIYRKAQGLGLCDPPARDIVGAFMDSDEGPRAA